MQVNLLYMDVTGISTGAFDGMFFRFCPSTINQQPIKIAKKSQISNAVRTKVTHALNDDIMAK